MLRKLWKTTTFNIQWKYQLEYNKHNIKINYVHVLDYYVIVLYFWFTPSISSHKFVM